MPAARSRALLASELDTAPLIVSLMVGQRIDELVDGGAGADTDQFTGHHILQCSLADHGLEFVLRNHRFDRRWAPHRFGTMGGTTSDYPMSLIPYALARPFLFGLDAETAHELTLDALARTQRTPLAWAYCAGMVEDPIQLAGLRFPNRVGLAAGLDKNARCIDALGAMGFGFVEVGTVTPKAQPGNPKPRMFRLPQAQALINRLGFNNDGLRGLRRQCQAVDVPQQGANPGPEHRQERHHARSRTPPETICSAWTACIRMPTT